MTAAPLLALSAARDPQAEAAVTGGLDAFNKATFGHVHRQTLDIVVRDKNGRDGLGGPIVGGLLGRSSLGLFFLDLFYLPENLRGAGLGSRIIALAEDEARRRGCCAAFVYTVTFQAPGFYERHGYRRFGEIACPPAGATRIFLTKPLD
jgi:GNAT superfamily N-acetyltransferase